MPQKDCDPRCTGKCNKKRFIPAQTANKGCDPRCTGRCSKRNAGVPAIYNDQPNIEPIESNQPNVKPIENDQPNVKPIENIPIPTSEENKATDTTRDTKVDAQTELLLLGEIQYVIMDLDGVILDIETVYQWVIEDLAKKYNIPSEEVQHIIDLQDEETAKKLCTDYNLAISPQDFMIEFRNTSIKHLAKTPLMPGIEKLINNFTENNISVAVASTSNEEAFKLKTQNHTQFFKKFNHIVLGNSDPEVDARKPSPKIYEVCGSRFPSKPNPNTILVFEDAPEGVVAAKRAQMKVIWFPNKYMNKEHNPGALAVFDSIEAFDPQHFGLPPLKK